MGTGEWVAAGAIAAVLCFVLSAVAVAVVYAALQIKKLIASIDAGRSATDALLKVIEGQKEAFAEAPALFRALSGMASRQVAEIARLNTAVERFAALILKPSEGASPYYPPADDKDKSIAYGAQQYREQGYNEEESAARSLVDFEQRRTAAVTLGE